jgi:hypothetical protein
MPIQLNEQDGGKILVVHVSGKLAKVDYERFAPEFERLVRQHSKLRVLFDMTTSTTPKRLKRAPGCAKRSGFG